MTHMLSVDHYAFFMLTDSGTHRCKPGPMSNGIETGAPFRTMYVYSQLSTLHPSSGARYAPCKKSVLSDVRASEVPSVLTLRGAHFINRMLRHCGMPVLNPLDSIPAMTGKLETWGYQSRYSFVRTQRPST
jgi:hypothetical protein